ncbi:hypothetical protein ACFSTC_00485 [Nonomuraea ferruginea]
MLDETQRRPPRGQDGGRQGVVAETVDDRQHGGALRLQERQQGLLLAVAHRPTPFADQPAAPQASGRP